MYTDIHLARRVIDICHSLMEFREPRVGVTAFDPEDTRLAECDPVKGVLVLRDKYFSQIELILAVAHECRHLHQYAIGGLNERLRVRPVMNNKVEYNLMPEEVDANAFGAIIVQELCGVKLLWNGMPQEVKDAIAAAEIKILEELQ